MSTINLSPSLLQIDLQTFTRVTVHGEKEIARLFRNCLLQALTLIPRDPKHHCGPLVRAGAYEGQEINGVLAQIHPISP